MREGVQPFGGRRGGVYPPRVFLAWDKRKRAGGRSPRPPLPLSFPYTPADDCADVVAHLSRCATQTFWSWRAFFNNKGYEPARVNIGHHSTVVFSPALVPLGGGGVRFLGRMVSLCSSCTVKECLQFAAVFLCVFLHSCDFKIRRVSDKAGRRVRNGPRQV